MSTRVKSILLEEFKKALAEMQKSLEQLMRSRLPLLVILLLFQLILLRLLRRLLFPFSFLQYARTLHKFQIND